MTKYNELTTLKYCSTNQSVLVYAFIKYYVITAKKQDNQSLGSQAGHTPELSSNS